jgi:hypothetical protein
MKRRLQLNTTQLQAQCDVFNANIKVGDDVIVKRDFSGDVKTVTVTEAQILSGHSAVVWLKDVSGCYLIDRVRKVTS